MRGKMAVLVVVGAALAVVSGCGKKEEAPAGAPVEGKESSAPEGRSERRGPAELAGKAAPEKPAEAAPAAEAAPEKPAEAAPAAEAAPEKPAEAAPAAEAAPEKPAEAAPAAEAAPEKPAEAAPAGEVAPATALGAAPAGEPGPEEPAAAAAGSGTGDPRPSTLDPPDYVPPPFQNVDETKWEKKARSDMLIFLEQSYRHRIKDPRVLTAMGNVPRHLYLLPEDREAGNSYKQMWYKIGYGQTITDPGMVAYMTQLLAIKPTDKVLEIGTGSGYQGSVLVQLTPNVFTIEIVEKLAQRSHKLLDSLGYGETVLRRKIADGYWGWEEEAPFDKIIVTCAADHVPVPLLQQLRPGGLMVVPVGPRYQPGKLHFIAKDDAGQVHEKVLGTVEFVPLTRRKVEKTEEAK